MLHNFHLKNMKKSKANQSSYSVYLMLGKKINLTTPWINAECLTNRRHLLLTRLTVFQP